MNRKKPPTPNGILVGCGFVLGWLVATLWSQICALTVFADFAAERGLSFWSACVSPKTLWSYATSWTGIRTSLICASLQLGVLVALAGLVVVLDRRQ